MKQNGNLDSVRKNGMELQHIDLQTREICLAAVKQNGLALQYVRKQTKEIRLAAIYQNSLAGKCSTQKNKNYGEKI